MENDEGKFVDLYVPRKCSATGRLIGAKDHGSIQLNVAEIDALGHYHGKYSTFAICGYLRKRGESDSCLNRLFHERGLLSFSKRTTKIKCIPRNMYCPYLSLKLGNQVFETEVINKVRSPHWKKNVFRFSFTKKIKHQRLCFKLYNFESDSTSTCMAQGLLDLYIILPHELYDIKSYEELYKLRDTNVFYDDWVVLEENALPIAYLHVILTVEPPKCEEASNSDSLSTFRHVDESNEIHEIPLHETYKKDEDSQKWNFRNLNDNGIEETNIQKHRFSICSQTRTLPDISLSVQQKPFPMKPNAKKNLPSLLNTEWETDNPASNKTSRFTEKNIPYSLTSDSGINRALVNILKPQMLEAFNAIEKSPKGVLTYLCQSVSNMKVKEVSKNENLPNTCSIQRQTKNLDRIQKIKSRNKVILSNLKKFLNDGCHRVVSQGNKLLQSQIVTENPENPHAENENKSETNPSVKRSYATDFIHNDTMEPNGIASCPHALKSSANPLNFSTDIHDTVNRLMQIFPSLSLEEASKVVQRHRLIQTSLLKQCRRTMTLQNELHSLLIYKLKLSLPLQEPLRIAMESNFYNFMQTHHTNLSLSKNSNVKALLIFCTYKHLKKDYHLNYDIKDSIFLALQFLEKMFNVQLTEENAMICNTSTQQGSLGVTTESIFGALYWLKEYGNNTKKLLLYYMGYSSLNSRDSETVMVTDEGHPIAFYQLKNIFNCDIPDTSQLICLFNYIVCPLNSKIHQQSLQKLETIYKNDWNHRKWILTKNPKAFYSDQTNHVFITFDNVTPNQPQDFPCYHLIVSLTLWTQLSPIIGNPLLSCSIQTNVLGDLKKNFPDLPLNESKLKNQNLHKQSFHQGQQVALTPLQSYPDHVGYEQCMLSQPINKVDQRHETNVHGSSSTCHTNSLANVTSHVVNKTHHHHVIVKSSINKNYWNHQLYPYPFPQSY